MEVLIVLGIICASVYIVTGIFHFVMRLVEYKKREAMDQAVTEGWCGIAEKDEYSLRWRKERDKVIPPAVVVSLERLQLDNALRKAELEARRLNKQL